MSKDWCVVKYREYCIAVICSKMISVFYVNFCIFDHISLLFIEIIEFYNTHYLFVKRVSSKLKIIFIYVILQCSLLLCGNDNIFEQVIHAIYATRLIKSDIRLLTSNKILFESISWRKHSSLAFLNVNNSIKISSCPNWE